MARPTAEDRRLDYLRVGAAIVSEFGRTHDRDVRLDALANVKVAEVAQRAGVTKGALYHIWPSQEAYRRDLLEHLLQLEEQDSIQEIQVALAGVGPSDDTVSAVHRLVDFAYQRLKDDPKVLVRFSFYNYSDDPEVKRLLGIGGSSFEPYFGAYLAASGRRPRPPFTLQQLTTSTAAYFFGMIMRHRSSPELVERPVEHDGREWSLYAFGVLALLEYFTEPVADGPARAAQPSS
jgi:AcrR family transcriptional regulator